VGEHIGFAWVRDRHAEAERTLTVCTGALIAASAGLLAGQRAATHQMPTRNWPRPAPRQTPAVASTRLPGRGWCDPDTLWTSAGGSAGSDLALDAVESLNDRSLRKAAEEEMEWGVGWTSQSRSTAGHDDDRVILQAKG